MWKYWLCHGRHPDTLGHERGACIVLAVSTLAVWLVRRRRAACLLLVKENGSSNIYSEYQTSLIYKGYLGPAVKSSIRFNVSYTIPVG